MRRLAGTMYIHELAKKVGTSDSNLDRWARDHRVNLNALKYKESTINEVLAHYFQHGRPATETRFPNVCVRSIVERYAKGVCPRQKRWTADQIIEAAQMAGLVSMPAQAKYFARPRANTGAIKSLWMKHFKQGGGSMNGLSWHLASRLVGPRCKPVTTGYWNSRHSRTEQPMARRIVLWTDLEKHLDRSQPRWIRETIGTMARFQRWLHGVEHIRPRAIRLIQEREVYAKRSAKV